MWVFGVLNHETLNPGYRVSGGLGFWGSGAFLGFGPALYTPSCCTFAFCMSLSAAFGFRMLGLGL